MTEGKGDDVSDYELSLSLTRLLLRSYAPLFFWFSTSPRFGFPPRLPRNSKSYLDPPLLSLLLLIS